MNHPFQQIPAGARRRWFAGASGAALLTMAALTALDRALRTEAAPFGIVSFEFAATDARAAAMVASWEGGAARAAAFSLGVDYLFLLLYSAAVALAAILTAEVTARVGWIALSRLGRPIAWGALVAGTLDAVENTALWFVLSGHRGDALPLLAAGCAAVKFALVLVGLLYAGAGAVAAGVGRRRAQT